LLTEAHFQFEGGRVGKKVADLGKQQNCFFSVRYLSTLPAVRAPLNPKKTKSCSKLFKDVQSCSKLFKAVQSCSKLFKDQLFYLQAAWV
jgi:hypothetical protein